MQKKHDHTTTNKTALSYKQGTRPRSHRSSLDRVIPTREAPLARCKVEGCQSVTTVGPLCLAHWEAKVAMRELGKTVKLNTATPAQTSANQDTRPLTLSDNRAN